MFDAAPEPTTQPGICLREVLTVPNVLPTWPFRTYGRMYCVRDASEQDPSVIRATAILRRSIIYGVGIEVWLKDLEEEVAFSPRAQTGRGASQACPLTV